MSVYIPGFGVLPNGTAQALLSLKDSTGAEIGERINISDEVAAHVGYVIRQDRVASGDNRPPDSGVQSGVQNPEEGGKSA